MEEKDLFRGITENYTVCFLDGCPKADTCTRRVAFNRTNTIYNSAPCVLPKVMQMTECPMYVEFKIVRKAYGLSRMFDNVAKKDVVSMRNAVMNIIGSRTGYYRVFRGEKYLTEEQQKEIMEYFQSRGYVNTSLFDGYIEEYNA